MRHLILSLFAYSALICAYADQGKRSPIDYLVEGLSNNFVWRNGIYNPLKLGKNASFEELTSEYLEKRSFKFGRIKDYKIEEAKECKIGPSCSSYKIVRISSDQGGKFLIFLYEPDGWWNKSYDAKEEVRKAETEPDAVPKGSR